MEFMDVSEETSDTLSGRFDNLSVIHTKVTKLDTDNKVCRVSLSDHHYQHSDTLIDIRRLLFIA